MWDIVVASTSVLIYFIIIKQYKKYRCIYLFFITTLIWLRHSLSAFHEFTFSPVIAGMSINALVSILVVILGIRMMPTYLWSLKFLLPIYAFIVCIFISSVISGQYLGAIAVLTKWLYLLNLGLMIYHVFKKHGEKITLLCMLTAFTLPVVLEVFSILMGHAKATEGDNSVSYIGGYHHEAAFSLVVFGFLVLVVLLKKGMIKHQPLLVMFACICLFFVNYRTALMGVIPIFFLFYWDYTMNLIVKSQRYIIAVFLCFSGLVFVSVLFPLVSERFSDVYVVIENIGNLFKADIYYTEDEADLFSGRVYLWSRYLTEFFNSSPLQWIVGLGPDAWKATLPIYAHNTFVSFLYEFGFLGLFVFLWVILKPIMGLFSTKSSSTRNRLIACYIGFIILNFATMPLWNVEGIILYGILIGYSWFLLLENQKINLK